MKNKHKQYFISDYTLLVYPNCFDNIQKQNEWDCTICSDKKLGFNSFISKNDQSPYLCNICPICTTKYRFDSGNEKLIKQGFSILKIKGYL